ncbi:hypothetical protein [Geomicrobium sp. JCM 19039]|uniref:hypothetical protein n=1 Tax=Geomicrobium sp. JCM 19039 TaxID=1460636 RepID=UPI00045F282A|nr:hypothetical protein [Geomicrobium sp. JCM 19039]GAK11999.1 hypothetical protein JCM19039_1726 [Geomicrobium sp. JCM 19039]
MGKIINDYRTFGVRYFMKRVSLFIIGLMVMAFGGNLMIQSTMGTATWDVLHIGLANLTLYRSVLWYRLSDYL